MTNAETIRRAMSLLGSRNTDAQQRARRANAAKLNAGKPRYSPEEKRLRAAARMRAYRARRKSSLTQQTTKPQQQHGN